MPSLLPMIQIEVKDGQMFCDSLQVAEKFGKRHEFVLRSIEKLLADPDFISEVGQHKFVLSSYLTDQNRAQKKYLVTRDGFIFLAMGYKGKEARKWQGQFLDAFNAMEKVISGQIGSWLKARKLVKEVRRTMTDRVKDYVALAVSQGSETYKTRPQLAYSNMTKMTNRALGITDKRDDLPELKLSQLSVTENRIGEILDNKIKNNEPYKEIFQDTKTEVAKIAVALGVATPEQKRITSASN